MAHMIETMAYANTPPWHGLGVPVEPDISTDAMLVRAGLDWTVEKLPLFTTVGDSAVPIPSHHALTRSTDGAVLSVVGAAYEPVQNAEALDFFRAFVEAGDMTLETAGSLGGGRRIWALASIRDGFELAGGDAVTGHLLLANSHIQNAALVAMFTPIRVVCSNTLAMALRGGGAGVFRHAHHAAFDPGRAKAVLGLARGQLAEFRETAGFLASRRYCQDEVARFFLEVFDPERAANASGTDTGVPLPRVAMALDALDTQPGGELAAAAGSWWGAANAVTFLQDHRLGRSAETRLSSSWFGEGRQFKLRALRLAAEYARAA